MANYNDMSFDDINWTQAEEEARQASSSSATVGKGGQDPGGTSKCLGKRKLGEMGSTERVVETGVKRNCSTSERGVLKQNATLRSNGSGCVILIKAVGANEESFLKDPVGLAKGLRNSDISKVKDVKIRTNKIRKVVAVEIPEEESQWKGKLLDIKRIGKWDVMCSTPKVERTVLGVIGPIDPAVDMKELEEMMRCEDGSIVKSVSRLNKFTGGQKQPSSAVQVTFEGTSLPERIFVDVLSFKVRRYNMPPMRCFKCQRLGHLASGCRGKNTCLLCGGSHTKDSCTANQHKCSNCGGPHRASSRECKYIQSAREIERLKQTGYTFSEARNILMSGQGSSAEVARPDGRLGLQWQVDYEEDQLPRKGVGQSSVSGVRYADVVQRSINIGEE